MAKRRRYVPAVGPKLRKLLYVVFALFALLAINAVYLSSISLAEWFSGETYQNFFYQYMFLAHLVLGLVIVLPVIVYGAIHIKNARNRPNRRAVQAGYALFVVSLVLLATGLVLTRGIPLIEVRQPAARSAAYWMHALSPLVVAWLFVLHRLAGKGINWRFGGAIAGVAAVFALAMLSLHAQDPRSWNQAGPESGEQYFKPSLARTATGDFIPARALMMDEYCADCHADVHASWQNSVHRVASFNNPVYLSSIRNTRKFLLQRDGDVHAARFCAGCHDPVPFFSGAFDDPAFDDVNHPTSQAGITCTGCHAITNVNSPRGNGDYTIEEPVHYPFAYSESERWKWVNHLLVKSNPEMHKKTFLKDLHTTTEFCGTCHKVHLPEALNGYKWLRGQNHYDSFLLSGVSGHGVASFYYPEKAEANCNGCHMELVESEDFGAKTYPDEDGLYVHDHQFPSANTAIPHLLGMPPEVNEAHREMLEDSLRVDIFAVRADGAVDGSLLGPIGEAPVVLEPGKDYLVEIVLRTMTLGHLFTQGTSDSNEVWLDVKAESGGRVIGTSGSMDPATGIVDPWAHFVNSYVLDKDGNRIERRNVEDIFVSLYNNQIPPGAADVVHYRLSVPEDTTGPVTLSAVLNYRKFDTGVYRFFTGQSDAKNDLPVTAIASTAVTLPVTGEPLTVTAPDIVSWQRWNDYGIGLLRKRGLGQLRQAEEAFVQVEQAGRGDGPLNLARVYLREGRLDEAAEALGRARDLDAYPWSVAWFSGQVNLQNGFVEKAMADFRALTQTNFGQARERGFDFSKDYRLLNALGQTYFEIAKTFRADKGNRTTFLDYAKDTFASALKIDPENVAAHYGLSQVATALGDEKLAERHRGLHATYRVDDNARDRAVARARAKDPAADRAANDVVIYDLVPPATGLVKAQ